MKMEWKGHCTSYDTMIYLWINIFRRVNCGVNIVLKKIIFCISNSKMLSHLLILNYQSQLRIIMFTSFLLMKSLCKYQWRQIITDFVATIQRLLIKKKQPLCCYQQRC